MSESVPASFSVMNLFQKGWEVFKVAWTKVLLIGFVIILIEVLVEASSQAAQKTDSSALVLLISFVSLVIGIIIQSGMIVASLRFIREKTAEVSDLFAKRDIWFNFFLASLGYQLLVLLGIILLIIPGLYWAAKYSLVMYLVVDKGMGVSDAFRKSDELTKGHLWQIVGFWLLSFLVNLGGMIALGVGLFITIPVTGLAQAFLYETLMGAAPAAAGAQAVPAAPAATPTKSEEQPPTESIKL